MMSTKTVKKKKFKKDIRNLVIGFIAALFFLVILGVIISTTGFWMIGYGFYLMCGMLLSVIGLLIFLRIVFYFVDIL